MMPGTEALPDKAWLAPVGKICSMRLGTEALPDEA